MHTPARPDNPLGAFLRDRRARLDPAALGFPGGRRRTPGLRREEVAQRAEISATWYTWLEQGRGGAPSAPVLDRLARALLLTEVEREHLYLTALGRPPEARYRENDAVPPRLQRVLDLLDPTPALIRTAIWDVIAWNRGAMAMLMDGNRVPPQERNVLRTIFLNPDVRARQHDWEAVARYVVGAFRVDAARAGAAAEIAPLIEELSRESAEFRAMWQETELSGPVEYVKHIRHPALGPLAFETSAFAVDNRPDLSMIVYAPADAETAARLRAAIG